MSYSEDYNRDYVNESFPNVNSLSELKPYNFSTPICQNKSSLTVEDHFSYFNKLLSQAKDYQVVQKAKNTYDTTKNSCSFLERTLTKLENRAQEILNYSAPAYKEYIFPATNRLVNVYNKGLQSSKFAVDKTKNVALTSGTLGLGLALVATQMGLLASAVTTNIFFDGIIFAKNASGSAYSKAVDFEKYLEDCIRSAIDVTLNLAKNPSEKFNEHANTFLDIANNVFEQLLSLPKEHEVTKNKVSNRIVFLARRIGSKLSNSANTQIVEPLQRQVFTVIEQLQKSLTLIEYVKKQREWTFQQVDHLSTSVLEFRTKVEQEARLAVLKPEEALVRSIHNASSKLNESLIKLRENSAEVLNESFNKRLTTAVDYIQQLDKNLEKSEDIYQVQEEVIDEAMHKLKEFSQWLQ